MSCLTHKHLETFVFDPHRASEDEVCAMATELISLRQTLNGIVLDQYRSPSTGYAAGRCLATTLDPTDNTGRCLWCELPDGHAGKHHAERPQWVPAGVEGFMTDVPVLVDWPDPEDVEVQEVQS